MTGGVDGFKVDPEALVEFAATCYRRADEFAEIHGRLRGAGVGRSSFGIMPASFTLFDQYESCLDESLLALADGVEMMETIAEGVAAERDAYLATDAAAAARFSTGQ